MIITPMKWCSLRFRRCWSREGGMEISGTGTFIDLRIEADDIYGTIDPGLQISSPITRGYVKVKGRIACIGPSGGGCGLDYTPATGTPSVTIEAGEITATTAPGVICSYKGLKIKNTRVSSTFNDAADGAAISLDGDVASDFTIYNVVMVAHASATNSMNSTSQENTIKVYGACCANKALATDNPGVSGIIEQVGTTKIDANVS